MIRKAKEKYSDFLFRVAKNKTEGIVVDGSRMSKMAYMDVYAIYSKLEDFDSTYKREEVQKLKNEANKK